MDLNERIALAVIANAQNAEKVLEIAQDAVRLKRVLFLVEGLAQYAATLEHLTLPLSSAEQDDMHNLYRVMRASRDLKSELDALLRGGDDDDDTNIELKSEGDQP